MNNGSTVNLEGDIASGGVQGYSAYEIAVKNGFVGTEEEWVNSFLTPDGYLKISSVVDNLTSSYQDRPLSANQGKALKAMIDLNTEKSLNNETAIIEEKGNREANEASLQSQISSLASGSPLAASSIVEMTDTTRIYVNTTDGNWYYYNGSSWISGGVYQSTQLDSSLLTKIFTRKLIMPKYRWLVRGGINYSTGANTNTDYFMRCNEYFRNGILIKNNNINHNVTINYYRRNADYTVSHIDGEFTKIEDTLFHLIDFPGATHIKVAISSKDSSALSSDDYYELFNNVEFYVIPKNTSLNDLNYEPEEWAGGGISATLQTQSGNQIYPGQKMIGSVPAYNFSHYVSQPIHYNVNKLISIKIKKDLTEENTFGFNIYLYNEEKRFLNCQTDFKKELTIFLPKEYTLFVVFYRGNNTRFDILDICNFLDLESKGITRYSTENYYKIPLFSQRALFLEDSAFEGTKLAVQGITNDGEYIYTSGNKNVANNKVIISKIAMSDLTDITRTDERSYYHGNGLAYNAKDNVVAVCDMQDTIYLLKADTLEEISSFNAKDMLATEGININNVSSIAYNNNYNIYCLYCIYHDTTDETSYRRSFILTDNNFKFIKEISFISPKAISYDTTGGCYITDNYIILCNYDSINNSSRLLFYNWKGQLINYLDVDYAREIEGITVVDDTLYIAYNIAGFMTYKIYSMKIHLYELRTDLDIANDFQSMNNRNYQRTIDVNNTPYYYDDINQLDNSSVAFDWY